MAKVNTVFSYTVIKKKTLNIPLYRFEVLPAACLSQKKTIKKLTLKRIYQMQ